MKVLKYFDQKNLFYFLNEWNSVIKKEQASVNLSFQSFHIKINFIIDKYAPVKKASKDKLKFESKPWITSSIQKSISVTLLKGSKQSYLTNDIETNINDLKDTWKGIKKVMSLK